MSINNFAVVTVIIIIIVAIIFGYDTKYVMELNLYYIILWNNTHITQLVWYWIYPIISLFIVSLIVMLLI